MNRTRQAGATVLTFDPNRPKAIRVDRTLIEGTPDRVRTELGVPSADVDFTCGRC